MAKNTVTQHTPRPRLPPPWQQTVSLPVLRKMMIYLGEKTSQWQTSISPSTARKKSCSPPTPVCLFCPLCITHTPPRTVFLSHKTTPGIKSLPKKILKVHLSSISSSLLLQKGNLLRFSILLTLAHTLPCAFQAAGPQSPVEHTNLFNHSLWPLSIKHSEQVA